MATKKDYRPEDHEPKVTNPPSPPTPPSPPVEHHGQHDSGVPTVPFEIQHPKDVHEPAVPQTPRDAPSTFHRHFGGPTETPTPVPQTAEVAPAPHVTAAWEPPLPPPLELASTLTSATTSPVPAVSHEEQVRLAAEKVINDGFKRLTQHVQGNHDVEDAAAHAFRGLVSLIRHHGGSLSAEMDRVLTVAERWAANLGRATVIGTAVPPRA